MYDSKEGLPIHTANRLQRGGTILLNPDFEMEFSHLQKLVMPTDYRNLSQNIPNPLKT